MNAAIDRVMQTYGMLTSPEAAARMQAKLAEYIRMLFEAGETDVQRLTVCGLVYLRQQDGRNDPVRAGYTGL